MLLYDGHCGFCSGIVRCILRHDSAGTLRFASLDGAFARHVLAPYPPLAAADTVVWLDGDRPLARSDAALRVASYLGGRWRVLASARIVPRFVRDGVYGFIARNRGRLRAPCDDYFVPTPAMLARMIGDE